MYRPLIPAGPLKTAVSLRFLSMQDQILKMHFTIENTLPQISGTTWLVFENSYQSVEVLIDGMRVFEYGIEQKPILGQLLGNAPCRVALTSSDSQKTIMIRFTNNYSKPGIYVSTMHLRKQRGAHRLHTSPEPLG